MATGTALFGLKERQTTLGGLRNGMFFSAHIEAIGGAVPGKDGSFEGRDGFGKAVQCDVGSECCWNSFLQPDIALSF